MTENEVVNDIAAVLIVEQDHRAVAVIKPSQPAGRMISEVIAELRPRGCDATMDDDFASDIEKGIKAQQPWNPPSWD